MNLTLKRHWCTNTLSYTNIKTKINKIKRLHARHRSPYNHTVVQTDKNNFIHPNDSPQPRVSGSWNIPWAIEEIALYPPLLNDVPSVILWISICFTILDFFSNLCTNYYLQFTTQFTTKHWKSIHNNLFLCVFGSAVCLMWLCRLIFHTISSIKKKLHYI